MLTNDHSRVEISRPRTRAARVIRLAARPFFIYQYCSYLQYLVVTLGDTKQFTPAISKTLNPEWNVSFDLPIMGPQSLLLEAVCWDKERFGKDYLGEFDIAIEDLFADGKVSPEVS